MLTQKQSRRGKIGIIHLCIFAVVGLLVLHFATQGPSEPYYPKTSAMKEKQKTADDALAYYLAAAWGYLHNNEGGMDIQDVCTAVTREDWLWFEANFMSLGKQGDTFNIQGALGANQSVEISRFTVLNALLQSGASRRDAERVERKENGADSVNYVLREPDGFGGFKKYKVEVVRVNGYWKVKGFAGGLPKMKGGSQGNFSTEEDEDAPSTDTKRK